MRALLVLSSALFLTALAGCSGSSEDPGAPAAATATSTSTATDAPLATGNTTAPKPLELSCGVTVGLTGNANLNDGIGGCVLTSELPRDVTVQAADLPAGCIGWYDSTPGDSMTEGEFAVGDKMEKGSSMGAYCDATAAPGSEITATVA